MAVVGMSESARSHPRALPRLSLCTRDGAGAQALDYVCVLTYRV